MAVFAGPRLRTSLSLRLFRLVRLTVRVGPAPGSRFGGCPPSRDPTVRSDQWSGNGQHDEKREKKSICV